MGFSKSAKQPGPRASGLPWEENGPGLHGDETVFELDTGELVAVSVEPKWPDNNSGFAMHGWARWINKDGSSKTDPAGQAIETNITINLSQAQRDQHGDPALAREVMLAVLGEPPTMVPIPPNPDAPPPPEIAATMADWEAHPEKAPPGTVLTPDATEAAMIPWDSVARGNASIRTAISTIAVMEQGFDAGALLAQ